MPYKNIEDRRNNAARRRITGVSRRYEHVRSLRKNGWTLERFENARIEQSNRCAICLIIFEGTPYGDHEHVR
jgi:hypothetical protein